MLSSSSRPPPPHLARSRTRQYLPRTRASLLTLLVALQYARQRRSRLPRRPLAAWLTSKAPWTPRLRLLTLNSSAITSGGRYRSNMSPRTRQLKEVMLRDNNNNLPATPIETGPNLKHLWNPQAVAQPRRPRTSSFHKVPPPPRTPTATSPQFPQEDRQVLSRMPEILPLPVTQWLLLGRAATAVLPPKTSICQGQQVHQPRDLLLAGPCSQEDLRTANQHHLKSLTLTYTAESSNHSRDPAAVTLVCLQPPPQSSNRTKAWIMAGPASARALDSTRSGKMALSRGTRGPALWVNLVASSLAGAVRCLEVGNPSDNRSFNRLERRPRGILLLA